MDNLLQLIGKLKGKKTIGGSVLMMVGTGTYIGMLVVGLVKGQLTVQQVIEQGITPAGFFAMSCITLWSAFHAKNVQNGDA